MDDTSLSILGGVLIRLNYFARDHPAVSMERSTWMWPAAAFFVYCILVGLVHGAINKMYDNLKDSTFLWIVFYLAILVPGFLFMDSFLDKRHRKSEAYLTALQNFQVGFHALLDELDDILQPHGYKLVVGDVTEPSESVTSPPGTFVVRVQQVASSTREGAPRTLPPLSVEFLRRTTPVTTISAAGAMYSLLAKGVPVDVWTLGALMMRFRCAHKELRKDGKIECISRSLIISSLVIGPGIAVALSFWLNLDGIVIFAIWWIPVFVLLVPAFVLFLYAQERIEGNTKHELFRSATEKVSNLALDRHGVRLIYEVEPTFFRGVTQGVVKFVEATPSASAKGEATGVELEPAHIV